MFPNLGQFITRKNGVYGTLRLTKATMDTVIRVNEKLIIDSTILGHRAFPNTIAGAGRNAPLILTPATRLRNHICHYLFLRP